MSTTDDAGTTKWPLIGVVLAVLWVFVSGPSFESTAPAAVVRTLVGTLVVGLAVGLPIAYVTREMYTDRLAVGRSVAVVPAALRYMALFSWELLTANVDVAYRVLAPSMPIDPDVVAVPLRVQTDAAITTIANSITLTPGTLTMDYDDETNTLYVHAITGASDYRSVVDPIRAWEDLALVIFGEEADPSDPVPEAQVVTATRTMDSEGAADDAAGTGDGTGPDGGEDGGD